MQNYAEMKKSYDKKKSIDPALRLEDLERSTPRTAREARRSGRHAEGA